MTKFDPNASLPPPTRTCLLPSCGQQFPLLEAAPHKKFCCGKHRNLFHAEERRQAMVEIRRQIAHREVWGAGRGKGGGE